MGDPARRAEVENAEAAAWHARLSTPSVSHETLQEFYAWRATGDNAAAYNRVERMWATAASLSADPEIGRAVGEAFARRNRPRPAGMPGGLSGLAAAMAALVLVVGGVVWFQSRSPVHATGTGEQKIVQLADGSTLRLDTASQARVRFTGDGRRIELLQGQAYFEVAHDATRPFVVEAGTTRVTALGTVFDVRLRPGGTAVTLVSGAVVVDDGAAPGRPAQRLAAGQQAWVTSRGGVTRAVDAGIETSWTEGRLVFRDTPMIEAVAEMNRYLEDGIRLDAGGIGAVEVNGSFRAGDRDAFVAAATDIFGLRAVAANDGSVRLVAGENKSGEVPGVSPG